MQTPETHTTNHTPARHLLGHGQETTPGDFTPSRLRELALEHTPAVFAVRRWAHDHKPHSQFLHDCNVLCGACDRLNEYIADDRIGGNGVGGEHDDIRELPAQRERRVDIENQGKVAWKAINEARMSDAIGAIASALTIARGARLTEEQVPW